MFYFEKIDNKKILKSTLIDNAFFTTKESFIYTKDSQFEEITHQNKQSIKAFLNIENLISPIQEHTANIKIVNKKDQYINTDGLILTKKDSAIFLNFADCVPLIFYEKEKNIGAIAHAGWRGTAQKIGIKTIQKMQRLGCKIENIQAIIGPCIDKCCFEVKEDVQKKLYQTINLNPPHQEKIFVDLKEINKLQLQSLGIKNIDICPYCTVCNNDLFFSYRKENATKNRHSAILYLK